MQEIPETEKSREKSNTGCLASICYCMFLCGLSIILSAVIIFSVNDVFALVKADVTTRVTIEADETVSVIAERLADDGVIRYPKLFVLYARLTENTDNIAPGTYELSSSMDYRTILGEIEAESSGKPTVTVTVPEGMELEDIFALLEKSGVCEAWRLAAFAQYYDFGYSFLEGLPYSENRLEGYLFPDTYIFYINDTPQRVLSRMLANYKSKWTVDMKARLANINYSMRDVLIIASMIEKEAYLDEDRTRISSVIYNRLRSDTLTRLQIDATVQYILPERKEKLTAEDLAVESPYNTYLVEGLPAGPICNPGSAAIYAALYPDETDYYYYVACADGSHLFAETYSEHTINIEKVQADQEAEQND